MGLREGFSTTIYSSDGKLSTEVLFLPRADMQLSGRDQEEYVLKTLDTRRLEPFKPGRDAKSKLALFFAGSELTDPKFLQEWESRGTSRIRREVHVKQTHEVFAKEILTSSRIPIEESPLTGISFHEVMNKASAAGLGSWVAWSAVGPSPYLFIAVPAGIVLVSAAIGIGKGLEEGLRERIKRLFVPESGQSKVRKGKSEGTRKNRSAKLDLDGIRDAIELTRHKRN
jgi:hypothetical protein